MMHEWRPFVPHPGHHPKRTPSPLEKLNAKELQEAIAALQEVMQSAAGVTGALFAHLRRKAGRQLVRAVGDLGRMFEHSSAGGKFLGNAVVSWYNGARSDEFGFDATFAEAVRPIFQFLYRDYFRVDTKGAEAIPQRGPALIVANHSGGLPYDGAMLSMSILNNLSKTRYLRFLVDDFVPGLPLLGTFVERLGGVRASHENAMRLLAAGHLVGVFPEGLKGMEKGFEQRYQLQRFGRGGFIRLAMRTGVPIIPVAVVGAEEVHPVIWTSERLGRPIGAPYVPFTPTFPWLGPLGLVPMPVKWKIFFGTAMDYARYDPADAEDYDLVQRESEAVKRQVEGLLKQALAERPSMWMD